MYELTFAKNGREFTEKFQHRKAFEMAKRTVLNNGYIIVSEQRERK